MPKTRLAAAALLPLALVGCYSGKIVSDAEIPTTTNISSIMWTQAIIADAAFKRINAETYNEFDWQAFTNVGKREQLAGAKLKASFSRGEAWNGFADALVKHGVALVAAVEAKDQKVASDSLVEIKKACKGCHSQYR